MISQDQERMPDTDPKQRSGSARPSPAADRHENRIEQGGPSRRVRRYDIDWLRILAVLLLIPFHSARIFDVFETFYAKNAVTSEVLSYFIGFMNFWHMPLFFLIAGAATYFALGFRRGAEYGRERLKRLGIPFLFGLLVIVPPQSFYGVLTHHGEPGSLFNYYPHFFEVKNGDLSGYSGGFTQGHLWFILLLLVFSLVALPLFAFWRTHPDFIKRLATFCERPGAIYVLALPILVGGALPSLGGEKPFYYIAFFILGYVLMADERFRRSVDRHMAASLILGGITLTAILALAIFKVQFPKYSPGGILYYAIQCFTSWFCILGFLGLAHRFLNVKNRVLAYASEAAYPFYLLHQTVIVVIGYYVVQSSLGVALKFGIIAGLSLITTLLIYDVIVRRTSVLRFLFGMKPRARVLKPAHEPASAG
jgi:glucan biosynthesis protein C